VTVAVLAELQAKKLFPQSFVNEAMARGTLVARLRKYAAGDHDAKMTTEMKELLRVTGDTAPFVDNYQDIVIQSLVDRVVLQAVEADKDSDASVWAQEVYNENRLDALASEVIEAAIRDGDSYMLISYDSDEQRVCTTLEEAYDGVTGMIAYYRSKNVGKMDAAIKIWQVDSPVIPDDIWTRVNIYYPDRVEKYVSINDGPLQGWTENSLDGEFTEGPVFTYDMVDGSPLGIPVVHFRNRGRQNYGRSEIQSSMPLQDALNRILYSIVINAEYNGFGILVARGFDAPTALRPGAVVKISPSQPLSPDEIADLNRLPAGEMTAFLETARWLTSEIGKITRTPTPEFGGGDNASGESLKQREIGLIGKAERLQVTAGNAFEDVFTMAWRIQSAYGKEQPPEYTRWYARFKSAEIRDDKVTVENALKLLPVWGEAETLRAIAPVYDLDEKRVQDILQEKEQQKSNDLMLLARSGAMPSMGDFAGVEMVEDQPMPQDDVIESA
jgi:hypothetical protein